MLPLSVLPAPTMKPYACVACMGQNGPVVNFHREIRGLGFVFLCVKCVREAAVAAELIVREEAEEREEVVTVRSHAEKEVAWRDERIAKLEAEIAEQERKMALTEEMLGHEHGRVIQLESRMAEQAKRALELIGAPDAA